MTSHSSSPPSPLGGRALDLATIADVLAGDDRLTTLTGPVGVGKSWVASAAIEAATRQGTFEAVVTIDVAGATTREAVLGRAARALGLAAPEELDPAREAQRSARAIADRGQALVVVDGADEAIDAVRAIAGEWLAVANEARLLVTSRARLGVDGERVVEIAPLALPRESELDAPAVAFLVACARRHQPAFAPSPREAPFLAEITRELDGLPLALKLAASRLAVMGPAALLHRLRQSRSVLGGRASAGADRHRSFDAALEGSWLALDPRERSALTSLSVFSSFAIDDAEAVIAVDRSAGAPKVVEIVEALREKSLLAIDPRGEVGEVRLRLLASVADFVRRRAEPGELEAANAMHARRYGDLARRLATESKAPRRVLDLDGENFLALIRRALASARVTVRDAEPALWALLALAPGLEPSPSLAAHASILERVLDATQDSGADPKLLGRAFGLRGALRRRDGDLAGATRDLGRALHLARTLGDVELEGAALVEAAIVVDATGDSETARQQAQRAVQCIASAGAHAAETRALLVLAGIEIGRREAAAAKAIILRALALAEARGVDREERRARLALASLLVDQRALDEARSQIARARLGADAAALAACDRIEGACFLDEGDLARASERFVTSASSARRLGLAAEEARALVASSLIGIERRSFAESYAQLTMAIEIAKGSDRAVAEALRAAAARLDADGSADVNAAIPVVARPFERALVELSSSVGDRAAYPSARSTLVASWSDRTLARAVVRAFDRALAIPGRSIEPPRDALAIGPGGRWFRAPNAGAVSLDRRRPLALLLDRLATARQAEPGASVSWSDLVAAGWPGEKMIAATGAHRVRVALSTLRKLGLRDLLRTTPEGYALDTAHPLYRAEDELAS